MPGPYGRIASAAQRPLRAGHSAAYFDEDNKIIEPRCLDMTRKAIAWVQI